MPNKTIIIVIDPELLIKGIGKKISSETVNKIKPEINLPCNWDKKINLGFDITKIFST